MHGVRRLIIFCILIIIVPIILIIIPLYLRHIFYADVAYAVRESDIIEINDGISTIFCSDHTLQMNGSFNAFQMAHRPEITSKRKHIRLKKSMNLPDDTLEYWGFYLLKGASVALSVCSRFEGASILVVKGEKNLRTCGLLEHNVNKQIQGIFLPGANKQVKIIYESNAQEINSKETTTFQPIDMYNSDEIHKLVLNTSFENSMEKKTTIQPIDIFNSDEIYKSSLNASFENPIEKIIEINPDNKTYAMDEELVKKLEMLYDAAASYIHKHTSDQHEGANSTKKVRHVKHHKARRYNNKNTKKKKRHFNYYKRKRLQKLKQMLYPSITVNEKKKQKTKEKNENTKRFKRSRELIKPSLLDQGIKHGGNADKNYTSSSDQTSSISSFESGLLNCYNGTILLAHEFQPSDQCTNISYLLNGKHIQANHHVQQDGYYYYIFYSDNDIVSNDIYAIFDIYKPTFQYENVTKSCINQTECSFRLNLLSADRVIIEIPTKDGIEQDDTEDVSMLISICKPRMGIYMIFPIMLLIIILGCAFI